jgi:hypothetical protein
MGIIQRKCHCGVVYPAREADLKRGWGMSCSKKCAAEKRTSDICRGVHRKAKASKRYKTRPNDTRGGSFRYIKPGMERDESSYSVYDREDMPHIFSEDALGQYGGI